jgi:Histidine kinase/GHKL domain
MFATYQMHDKPQYNNILVALLMNRKLAPLRHIFLLLPLATNFLPPVEEIEKVLSLFLPAISKPDFIKALYLHQSLIFLLAVLFIYCNLYLLVPRLLFKNKIAWHFIACIFIAIIFFLADYYFSRQIFHKLPAVLELDLLPQLNFRSFISGTLMPLIFLGATTGYKLLKKWIEDSSRASNLKNMHLKEELEQLKNQVNPHFLFNTLNNLNTLVLTNPLKASQVVHGLSDVLRYQIYDSAHEHIALTKDIEMLNQFLLLETIRRDNFSYKINTNESINNISLPPLLFINFIDNALKHGADTRAPSFLNLSFTAQNKQLIFIAENSKPLLTANKTEGGLGLKNIRRRLDLLYGSRYTLTLSDQPQLYTVKLTIPI